MAYEPKDMTGSLFANDKREKETHPNTRGSALIDGVAYFVDGWTKTTGEGAKWISLSFKRKDKQPEGAKPRETAKGDRFHGTDDDFSDISF